MCASFQSLFFLVRAVGAVPLLKSLGSACRLRHRFPFAKNVLTRDAYGYTASIAMHRSRAGGKNPDVILVLAVFLTAYLAYRSRRTRSKSARVSAFFLLEFRINRNVLRHCQRKNKGLGQLRVTVPAAENVSFLFGSRRRIYHVTEQNRLVAYVLLTADECKHSCPCSDGLDFLDRDFASVIRYFYHAAYLNDVTEKSTSARQSNTVLSVAERHHRLAVRRTVFYIGYKALDQHRFSVSLRRGFSDRHRLVSYQPRDNVVLRVSAHRTEPLHLACLVVVCLAQNLPLAVSVPERLSRIGHVRAFAPLALTGTKRVACIRAGRFNRGF